MRNQLTPAKSFLAVIAIALFSVSCSSESQESQSMNASPAVAFKYTGKGTTDCANAAGKKGFNSAPMTIPEQGLECVDFNFNGGDGMFVGGNFRGTNFNHANFVFGMFQGLDLRGANLASVTGNLSLQGVIVDQHTKLPVKCMPKKSGKVVPFAKTMKVTCKI
jgi:hypothetical protein